MTFICNYNSLFCLFSLCFIILGSHFNRIFSYSLCFCCFLLYTQNNNKSIWIALSIKHIITETYAVFPSLNIDHFILWISCFMTDDDISFTVFRLDGSVSIHLLLIRFSVNLSLHVWTCSRLYFLFFSFAVRCVTSNLIFLMHENLVYITSFDSAWFWLCLWTWADLNETVRHHLPAILLLTSSITAACLSPDVKMVKTRWFYLTRTVNTSWLFFTASTGSFVYLEQFKQTLPPFNFT